MLNANLEYVDNVSTYMHKYRVRKYNFEACNTCEKYGLSNFEILETMNLARNTKLQNYKISKLARNTKL
jgi:hypothetical protein